MTPRQSPPSAGLAAPTIPAPEALPLPGSCPGRGGGPRRIQRQRTKGWRMPDGAIYVGRPSKWGNPYRVGGIVVQPANWYTPYADPYMAHLAPAGASLPRVEIRSRYDGGTYETRWFAVASAEQAVELYRQRLEFEGYDVSRFRGHDLVCWCPLDQPCHADVLLELANRPAGDSRELSRPARQGTDPGDHQTPQGASQ